MSRLRFWMLGAFLLLPSIGARADALVSGQLLFPLESWHNHGSCIVECPNSDMLVCWFHGSGERKADDVEILGARRVKATGEWSKPFSMAVSLSNDQGRSWKWTRHLEQREPEQGSFHYPSIIEGRDGNFHATYSYFVKETGKGNLPGKSIRYVTFNRDWLKGK